MKILVSCKQMQKLDEDTQMLYQLPGIVLMERAALSIYEELIKHNQRLSRVLIVCGIGNNGGDGLALARMLALNGIDVTISVLGDLQKASELTKLQISILKKYSIPVQYNNIPEKEYTTIVDAIFGIGLTRDVLGVFEIAVTYMNASNSWKVAVDIPSGIDGDTGIIHHVAVKADTTITFAYGKTGLYLFPGSEYAGNIIVKDIGIYIRPFNKKDQGPVIFSYDKEDLSLLKKRQTDSHKGTFGKLLLIAGSENMSGAAYLSAVAAYRSGAGLVKIYTAAKNREILQTLVPEAILETYQTAHTEEWDCSTLEKAIDWCDAAAIGPGFGTNSTSNKILLTVIQNMEKPLVIDADGLNLLSLQPNLLKGHKQPMIVTPHLGEMSRLTKVEPAVLKKSLVKSAYQFACENKLICVCKDSHSVITDGEDNICINLVGNDGMATAGSGDVLTGIISGLLVQGNSPFDAASLGAYIHGLAGDEAAKDSSKTVLMASDIIKYLYKIFKTKEVFENETI